MLPFRKFTYNLIDLKAINVEIRPFTPQRQRQVCTYTRMHGTYYIIYIHPGSQTVTRVPLPAPLSPHRHWPAGIRLHTSALQSFLIRRPHHNEVPRRKSVIKKHIRMARSLTRVPVQSEENSPFWMGLDAAEKGLWPGDHSRAFHVKNALNFGLS